MNLFANIKPDSVEVVGPDSILLKINLQTYPEVTIVALVDSSLGYFINSLPGLDSCHYRYTETHLEIMATGRLNAEAVAKYT
jgi:hypothetical protein